MNTLKELRHAYKCDTLKELAEELGIAGRTIYEWSAKGIPADKKRLLGRLLEEKLKNLKLEGNNEK